MTAAVLANMQFDIAEWDVLHVFAGLPAEFAADPGRALKYYLQPTAFVAPPREMVRRLQSQAVAVSVFSELSAAAKLPCFGRSSG